MTVPDNLDDGQPTPEHMLGFAPFSSISDVPRGIVGGAGDLQRYLPDESEIITEFGTAYGEAHAKSILIGEHSVVFGHPAIAVPVTSIRTVARVDAEEGPIRFGIDGDIIGIDELPERLAPLGEAARVALREFDEPEEGVLIRIRSGIPPAAGLGGSAAAAHAVIEGIRAFVGGELSEETRFELVQTAERVAHGNPSGLDAMATRSRVPVMFHQGETHEVNVGKPFWLVIGDTGVRGATSDAVARVRGYVNRDPARGEDLLNQLGELTRGVQRLLTDGDVPNLGACLDAAHLALEELGVGHPATSELVAAAREAGAVGAKITGAGCGGCVLAVAENAEIADKVSQAMTDANGVATWIVEVERN